jgi:hypothetical protein
LELYTLAAGTFWRKMSIEKSVNFLQPGGTIPDSDGDQGSQRFVAFRWPFPGDTG